MGVCSEIRRASARVMERARFVTIDRDRLASFALEISSLAAEPPSPDPEHHYQGDESSTLAYTVCLDAINFGSGWFPALRKRPGCSGYFTISMALADQFRSCGAWTSGELQGLGAGDCARVFGQDPMNVDAMELMALFARSLSDLGALLDRRYGGRFEALVEAAGGSAEQLVALLSKMPLYQDVSRYEGYEVPFYKRAQITSADLALAFGGQGFGAFHDLDVLTVFADNLVPHVLRMEGVLRYDAKLLARIQAGTPLEHRSPEEVEIRAAGVHAVEEMLGVLRSDQNPAAPAGSISARRLDHLLWYRGQRPEIKAHPRHRSRTTSY